MEAEVDVAAAMIVNDSTECPLCTLGPPPDMILRLPPPPAPAFLVHSTEFYPSDGLPFVEHFNSSPCKHSCEWRGKGVQYVEMPQQGTFFDGTWLLVLISSCIGIIFIGIVLATLLIKCKLQPVVSRSQDEASQCSSRSNKNSTLSTSTASSGMQTTTTSASQCRKPVARLQPEAVLYPCPGQQDPLQDSRLMWATLTPRGTTRHYLEEHTYESVEQQEHLEQQQPQQQHQRRQPSYSESPSEHVNLKTYSQPSVPSSILTRSKDEKAFDNTAFVDYEEPLSIKNEYYQLEDVLEPCDPIFSVEGLYGMRGPGGVGSLRPRVSSPTRIEHPNLPPLNLQPTRKQPLRHKSRTPDCTLLRGGGGGMASSGYIPNI
ncbi:PREDICTED: uncharacterized protein LOC105362837 [Ceratosolen solmsi marchali]|uniref:Uncharacterized protein LOC105362837 n=1 Tax=Ceratosolen solmsi marchali TaxID=326594 RepID=A0AAJ6YIE6_9HYME|nr:PREDICTED: uncharacterized protein LOC105362837 [Ceratosolen solmsi marchali]